MPSLNPALQDLWNAHDWLGVLRFYGVAVPDVMDRLDVRHLLLAWCAVIAVHYLWKHLRYRKPGIPLQLGSVTVDLQPAPTDTVHMAIGGFSGSGKSTAVLPLFDNERIGVLCVALDNSRPIARKIRHAQATGRRGYIEWSNEEDSPGYGVGLDLIDGPARNAVEVVMAGWKASQGETGKWRDIVANRLTKIVRSMDEAGEPRDWLILAERLNDCPKGMATEHVRACQDWAARLERLADTLGPSLGHELDLIEAMRQHRKVLLRLNRFVDPRLAPMLGGMLLVKARHVAQAAGVPFVLIVEEAGQMGTYAEHMTPLAQAGRDRQVPLVIITQNLSKLESEVVNNIKVWAIGAQEDDKEITFAAARLRLKDQLKDDPNLLYVESFADEARGWFYVRSPRVKTTLIRVRQQRLDTPTFSHSSIPTDLDPEYPEARRNTVEVVELWTPPTASPYPALPPPNIDEQELLDGFDKTPTCWVWRGPFDKDGYGYATVNGKRASTHKHMYELTYGPDSIGWEPNGKRLELDHYACNNRPCGNPSHLEVVTHAENMRRMHARRGHKVKRTEAA